DRFARLRAHAVRVRLELGRVRPGEPPVPGRVALALVLGRDRVGVSAPRRRPVWMLDRVVAGPTVGRSRVGRSRVGWSRVSGSGAGGSGAGACVRSRGDVLPIGGTPLLTGKRQCDRKPPPPTHGSKLASRAGGGKSAGGAISEASVYVRST